MLNTLPVSSKLAAVDVPRILSSKIEETSEAPPEKECFKIVCLFVLRFYGPVNPMGSCRVRPVNLTTHLLGSLSPLSG